MICPHCLQNKTMPTGSNTRKAQRKELGEGELICMDCWKVYKYEKKREKARREKLEGRKCPRCGCIKPLEQFYYRTSIGNSETSEEKRHSYCSSCTQKSAQLSNTKNRQKHLSSRYGLSIEDFESLAAHGCQICGATKEQRVLVVDHDHDTKKFRGVLCSLCNSAIGLLGDKPDTIFKAFYYLQSRKG